MEKGQVIKDKFDFFLWCVFLITHALISGANIMGTGQVIEDKCWPLQNQLPKKRANMLCTCN